MCLHCETAAGLIVSVKIASLTVRHKVKKKGRKQNVLMRQVVLFIVNENEPAEASESTQRDFHS